MEPRRSRSTSISIDRRSDSAPVQKTINIQELDKALEAVVLLRAGEEGYARDYRTGTAFGSEEDRRRLDAFTMGMLDMLARRLGNDEQVLPLLAYLKMLLDHGPGPLARQALAGMLRLRELPELRCYIAGGRRLVLQLLANKVVRPGLYARLLEEELQ